MSGYHLVHASGTQGGADHLDYGSASIDVADDLRTALGLVGTLAEQ